MADEKDKKVTDAEAKSTDAKASEAKAEKAEPKAAAKKPAAAKKTDDKTDAKAAKKPAAGSKSRAKAADKTDAKADKQAGAKKPAAKKSSAKKKPAEKSAPAEAVMVRATARYVRTSPRKSRLVVDHIRGDKVEDARIKLQFMARHVARDVLKVLNSAVANAEHNHEIDADELRVAIAYVDEGPTLKRWRPRARGRATQILKRTSHITVVVSNGTEKQIAEISTRKAAA